MMQGDSYSIGIALLNNAGQPVTPTDVIDVEITIGWESKRYSKGQLTFSNGLWLYPISQSESFEQWPGKTDAQARIKWNNGFVEGQPIQGARFLESKSKEVL